MHKSLLFGVLILSAVLTGCVNSQAEFATLPDAKTEGLEVATFAGGCFWCVESGFEKLQGVREAISGYIGGEFINPTYEAVSSGRTGHVEAVQVYYDPSLISYRQLVESLWRQTNPTDNGGQFSDRGKEYRTGIFYHNDEQKRIATASKAELNASGRFDKPVVTEIRPYTKFWPAETYHQDYYKKNPLRYKFYRHGSGRDQFLEKVWGEEQLGQSGAMEEKRHIKPDAEILRERHRTPHYELAVVVQELASAPRSKNPAGMSGVQASMQLPKALNQILRPQGKVLSLVNAFEISSIT